MFYPRLCRSRCRAPVWGAEVRKWRKLSAKGKKRRVFHAIRNFFARKIWGGYQRGGIAGAYHWVRCHTVRRYGIINLAKYSNGEYTWGWIDRDWAMYLACFHLLCDFVEKEDPGVGTRTIQDYGDDEFSRPLVAAQVEDEIEILRLYTWWKTERKAAHEAAGYDYKAREALDAKDEEMLQRLMKVRRRLWT